MMAFLSWKVTLTIGGIIAGIKSMKQGNSFFKAYDNYINQNWAQSLAISMALALTTFAIPNRGSFCFKAGTLIVTEDGHKKIEDVEVRDKVLSYNEDTGKSEYKEVVRLFRNQTNSTTSIKNDEMEPIVSTPNHPYYILDVDCSTPIINFEGRNNSEHRGQWVNAGDLKPGMKVLLSNKKMV